MNRGASVQLIADSPLEVMLLVEVLQYAHAQGDEIDWKSMTVIDDSDRERLIVTRAGRGRDTRCRFCFALQRYCRWRSHGSKRDRMAEWRNRYSQVPSACSAVSSPEAERECRRHVRARIVTRAARRADHRCASCP